MGTIPGVLYLRSFKYSGRWSFVIGQESLFNYAPSLKCRGWGVDYLAYRQRRLAAPMAYDRESETVAPMMMMKGKQERRSIVNPK